ncbi:hypothetical protein COLO4_25143 [Corchorus olitorius]|uniref:Uncharacterized protein n=2 Tax=Corchorus TaxID=93758 RepID=A0A1R3I4H7_9ROSI|nr:hypothetical protein COLO4_25143 [Corchorus olitorius]
MEHSGVCVGQNGKDDCFSSFNVKPIKIRNIGENEEEEESEPLSPIARMFHEPGSNVYIIFSLGFKDPLDSPTLKKNLLDTVLKHPRFTSLQIADEKNSKELKWVQTEIDLDNHIIVPKVGNMEPKAADQYVEDYISNLTKTNLSMSIPMWDAHLLNVKTSDGAVSHLVFRVHHSLGDGTSFISLLLSCSRKLSDPNSLPTFPAPKKKPISTSLWSRLFGAFIRFWTVLLVYWNTLVDVLFVVATTYFLKDTQTPLKAPSADVAFTSRRIVRCVLPLAEVKFIKNATNTTVNDVLVAVTEAALSRYLNRKYNEMMKKKSKAEWGNKIGYVIFPFTIGLKENPLDHIREVKVRMDRKKASLEAKFRFFIATVFLRFYRTKSLTINIVSYADTITMVLAADETIIPDTHQLCEDLQESLKLLKKSVLAEGLNN